MRATADAPAPIPSRSPPSARRHRAALGATAAWLAGIAVAAALLLPRLLVVAPTDDDGLVASQAMRVAAGQVPYRDYFSALMPGADLLYGGWFRLAGASYLSFRLLTAALIVAGAALLALLARRVLPPVWAAATALLWLAWCGMFLRLGPYHFAGVALVLAMLWLLLESRERVRAWLWVAGAGVCGGSAVVFTQSLIAAAAAGIVACMLLRPSPRLAPLLMAGAATGVGAAVLACLAAVGAFSDFWRQSVEFVLDSYAPVHRLAPPWLPQRLHDFPLDPWLLFGGWASRPLKLGFWLATFAVPLVLLGVSAVAIARPGRLRLRGDRSALVVASSGLFLPLLAFSRAPLSWIYAPLALALLVAAARALALRLPARIERPTLGLLALVLGAAMLVPPGTAVLARTGVKSGLRYRAVTAAGTTVFVDERHAETVADVLAFARSHPQDSVAFLPFLQAVYLLADRRPPVSHSLLLPGFDSDAEVEAVSRELVARRVRWVFYAPMPLANLAPNLPGAADRARGKPWRFEELLRRNYAPRERLGFVLSLRRVTRYELRR